MIFIKFFILTFKYLYLINFLKNVIKKGNLLLIFVLIFNFNLLI
jgi:hypothetical protein